MALNLRLFGEHRGGTPWVLVHGWGFGASVMFPLAERLAATRPVLAVDLPGCGASDATDCTADPFVLGQDVASQVPRSAHWLGWSLGALIAIGAAAREPTAVSSIALVAGSPRFTATVDWPGVTPAELRAFAQAVAADPADAHRRFLGFQLAGSAGAHRVLRELRRLTATEGLPARATLLGGLEMLRTCDLRTELAGLSCPIRAVLGTADPLVPVATGRRLAELGIDLRWIEGAGHVPFRSHPDAVTAALEEDP